MTKGEYFGYGSISNLSDILRQENPRRIFLVTGKKSYSLSNVNQSITPLLEGYETIHFNNFGWIPLIEDVKVGINLFRDRGYDFVIAVGGGSVIDMAKLINIFAAQDGAPEDYVFDRQKIMHDGKPLVAIPTTAGSGSETTHFAVVYLNKEKFSVADRRMLPTYSIVDPQFTTSLSARTTASSGMDALSQAIESFWSLKSTDVSRKFAKRAIELVLQNLIKAVNHPDLESRTSMAEAANLAGKAINITKTAAPHAVSYPLTAYFGIPHGHAVALTLGEFLAFNSRVTAENINGNIDVQLLSSVQKNIDDLLSILSVADGEEAKKKISGLMYSIGLETRLSQLEIQPKDIQLICKNVNLERLTNNPRTVPEKSLYKILENIS